MFEKNIFQLLKEVVTSWQVIVVTIALILYLNIVFYTAKAYRNPIIKKITIRKKKKPKTEDATAAPESSDNKDDSNNDLGLEEE